MKLLRRLLPAIAAVLLGTMPLLAAPAMWRVSDADSVIYLFGSIHIFARDVDWRTPAFNAALAEAEHVYFELVLDVDAYATLARLMLLDGRIRDGGTLWDLLGAAQTEEFTAAVAATGMPAATFDRMQPWMAELMLGGGMAGGAKAGVEIELDAELDPSRKRGFETMDEQMRLFSGLPRAQQIANLMDSVRQLGAGTDQGIAVLTDAWESGDIATLQDNVVAGFGGPESPRYRRLITERNLRWVGQIEDILASNEEAMVVVGAGHLIGPEGVPTLLEARGYKVERVDAPVAMPPGPRLDPRTPIRPR